MKTKIIIITSGIIISEVIWRLYKLYKHSQRKTVKVSNGCVKHPCKDTRNRAKISEVMFFSKESALCRPHLERRQLCNKANCAVGYFK